MIALAVGAFEFSFFAVAIAAHPDPASAVRQATDLPLTNAGFLWLAAAIIGATFNPWMIFYQQSATVEKGVRAKDLVHARWDTAVGAVVTQLLTGAVLVSAAAAFGARGHAVRLDNVGQISDALTPLLGANIGRVVFGIGVLGASLVAAIVCSLAAAWGVGEAAGYQRSLEQRPFRAWWFYAVYAAAIAGAAALVWFVTDLVWLVIAAQVLNVFRCRSCSRCWLCWPRRSFRGGAIARRLSRRGHHRLRNRIRAWPLWGHRGPVLKRGAQVMPVPIASARSASRRSPCRRLFPRRPWPRARRGRWRADRWRTRPRAGA